MKKIVLPSLCFLLFATANAQLNSKNITITLRNCQKDLRTATFNEETNFFLWCALDVLNLEQNRTAQFSEDYRMDSNFLRKGVQALKKSLPPRFNSEGIPDSARENEPDEKAIWFIKMFAQKDKSGNVKILSAYKVTFDGTDMRIDANRINPKITKVEFFTDKQSIQALEKKLKNSSPVNYD